MLLRLFLLPARRLGPAFGWALAAEAAWHAAGPAWAFAVLVAAITWVAGRLPAAMAASAKAYAIESRLDALVPNLPQPQARPGDATDGTYASANGSSAMSGGTTVTYGAGGNNGGVASNTSGVNGGIGYTGGANNGGHTSGQIGDAAQHYHDMSHEHGDQHDHSMTHFHTSSGDLQNVFNSLQSSHGNLVNSINQLRNSHQDLIGSHNNLLDTIKTARVFR